MSFGGQSNQWQRSNVGQLSSFQPQQMPMFLQQTPQQQANIAFGSWPGSAGSVSYPQPRAPGLNPVAFQQTLAASAVSSVPQAQHYNSIGTVTKINSGCGLVNDEVFFYRNVCKGHVPNLGDRVLFEAAFSSTGQFKWNATRIQLMPQQIQPQLLMGSTAAIKGSSGYNAVPPPNEYQRAQQIQRHSSPSRRLSTSRDRRTHSERERWDRKWNHSSRDRDEDNHDRKCRRGEDHDHSRHHINSTANRASVSVRSERERDRGEREEAKARDHSASDKRSFVAGQSAKLRPNKNHDRSKVSQGHNPVEPRTKSPLIRHGAAPRSATFKGPSKQSVPTPLGGTYTVRPTQADNTASPTPQAVSERPGTSRPLAKVKPSVRAYRDRRAAAKLVVKISAIPDKERTAKETESLIWAKKILAEDVERKTAATKRQRSSDNEHNASKGAKPTRLTNKAFSDVLKEHQVMAVLDKSNADGSISPDSWRSVEISLCKVYKDILQKNPGPAPECRDIGWHQDHIKIMACTDERSANLLKLAVAEVGEIWPGANLQVVPKSEIPNRPRSRAWIPAEPSKPEDILELLQLSNLNLPTSNWKVAKVSEPKGKFRLATVILNEDSVTQLAAREGVVSYGFSSIVLTIYKDEMEDALLTSESEDTDTTVIYVPHSENEDNTGGADQPAPL